VRICYDSDLSTIEPMSEPFSSTRKQPFRLGEWRVEPDLNRVVTAGKTRHVEPRVMELLSCLAARPRSVLSRTELLELVWRDVIVGEEALTRAVSELRRALDDDSRAPRFIETIHKSGYRLLALPEPIRDEGESESASAPRRATRRGALWAVAAVLIAVAALVGLTRGRRPGDTSSIRVLDATPLTSYPGAEEFPSISPDGNHVAFAWGGEDGTNVDLYVLQIGSSSRLRLTEHPGVDTYPRWSADGRTIAYVHHDESGQSIMAVPIIGGRPRELVHSAGWLGGMDWSVDGASLVFAEGTDEDAAGLFVLDLEGNARRALTPRPQQGIGDIAPACSPDGNTVAFVRVDGGGLQDIYLAPASGGAARRLTRGLLQVRGLDWTRDGASLICAAVSSAYYALWRVDASDGHLTRVPTRGEWTHYPSVASQSDRLVYQDIWFDKNVWRVRRSTDPVLGLSTQALLTSTRWDCEASYSPDGERIAFTSARSGSLEVWSAAADGSHLLQLTRFGKLNVGNPRWSPDSRSIAFQASDGGFPDLWVVGASGGRPERLTRCGHNHILTSWSRDGEWLYFGSDRAGTWELWKRRIDGPSGEEVQVTNGGGISGYEARDGKRLYFSRTDEAGLWYVPLGGETAPPVKLIEDLPQRGDWGNWSMADNGIVLAKRGDGGPVIAFYDFETGQLEDVTRVPNIAVPSLTVSPDGLSFLYARVEQRVSDVMMIDGFQ